MFAPIKATLKLANGNMVHDQGVGIILRRFHNCLIIYLVGTVYNCPGQPSNTIPSGALKFYAGFQKFTYEPLEHCDFAEPQGISWRSTYQTQNNPEYIQIEIFKVNLHRDRNIVVPTVCGL